MNTYSNKTAFLTLLRAGLWEKDAKLSEYGDMDFNEVYRYADEQSVLGLVAAGLEHATNAKVPQEIALAFAGFALQLEHRNIAMNLFLSELISLFQKKGINTLLVKGQGIAQCYERPLWRSAGDVDLLIDESNYFKAKQLLDSISEYGKNGSVKEQNSKHREYGIKNWTVELHGTLHSNLSTPIDNAIDSLQEYIFKERRFRTWNNNETYILLPNANEDVVIIFCHILQHLFQGGVGLRQICDLCRLLWTYKETIKQSLLQKRLRSMRLLSEWKVFASIAVDKLGMPLEAMPLYDDRYKEKANIIMDYIMRVGNFGHNKDKSYTKEHSVIIRKLITFKNQAKDSMKLSAVFPFDGPRFLIRYFWDGYKNAFNEN